MSWLVLDTAMPLATVAVVEGSRVLGAHVLSEPKRHAESLADALDRALLAASQTFDQVEGIGVGRGPGSFIGVRTGIAFAKGFALGRQVPVVGLPTLLALAYSAELGASKDGSPEGEGLVAIDAKRGEVFALSVSVLAGVLTAIGEPVALPMELARARATQAAFVIGNTQELLGHPDAGGRHVHLDGPSAEGLARALAHFTTNVVDEVDSLVPDYRRDADAKLPTADPSARRASLLGG